MHLQQDILEVTEIKKQNNQLQQPNMMLELNEEDKIWKKRKLIKKRHFKRKYNDILNKIDFNKE